MSKRGRKTEAERRERDRQEIPAFALGMALRRMPMVRLRVAQAISRYGADELLEPVIEMLAEIERDIQTAKGRLN